MTEETVPDDRPEADEQEALPAREEQLVALVVLLSLAVQMLLTPKRKPQDVVGMRASLAVCTQFLMDYWPSLYPKPPTTES